MEFADYIRTPKCDRVVLHQPLCAPMDGTLCLTGHHFIFSSRQSEEDEVWVLHRLIDGLDRRPNGMMGGSLSVKCKDMRILVLDIHGVEEFNNISHTLEALSNIDDIRLAYPFFFRSSPSVEDGWSEFSTEHEFSKLIMSSEDWRISHVNDDFKVCESYPRRVVVPSSVTDDELVRVALFRHGGRFPVLSYRHHKGSVLLRSSQPMTGNQRRCREDEKLINAALGSGGQKGYIIDTRTQNLALTAKNRGGGFEPESHYPQWRRVHKPIDRHAAQLDSLQRLVEGLNDQNQTVDRWLGRLVSSNWMSHVKDTLNCACLVAQCLDQEVTSVLVHGADGMDSTLQVSSLAQLILSPDCRTIRGFEALVEREWLQAGHPFTTRHRHSVYAPPLTRDRGHGMAPSFLLFLDCVWQVTHQFVTSFEFNDTFLLDLFQHSYASQYGTFLGDNVCERERVQLRERTCSLWSYVNRPEVLPLYLNPLYEPNKQVIWPSVAPMSLTLWPGMYLRWSVDLTSQNNALNRAHEIHEEHVKLKAKACKLRRRLQDLQQEAVTRDLLQPAATPEGL
ncbi:myotubularin-related protein 9-like isoform X2 [Pollicipes pollicipes]|nr:myotubularin-related protein 9-like isoform X2 [Pollicipes pollicipes]XP_037078969.1 myotubularin-related protein 9-like isoform X2 [Pollicipes pollicipes]XP_037078970.1 myotubularin-related protein 9-like isoform X2 [Pollicipes pollicipes]